MWPQWLQNFPGPETDWPQFVQNLLPSAGACIVLSSDPTLLSSMVSLATSIPWFASSAPLWRPFLASLPSLPKPFLAFSATSSMSSLSISNLSSTPCFCEELLLWLSTGGGGGGIAVSVVSISGSSGGDGGEVDGCSAFSTFFPHSGQNFWCSSISAPQLLQNTMMIQIISFQGSV